MAQGPIDGAGFRHHVQGPADDHQEAHNAAGPLDPPGHGLEHIEETGRMPGDEVEGVGIHHHPAAGCILHPLKGTGGNQIGGNGREDQDEENNDDRTGYRHFFVHRLLDGVLFVFSHDNSPLQQITDGRWPQPAAWSVQTWFPQWHIPGGYGPHPPGPPRNPGWGSPPGP